jgi:exonuclease SbcD
MAASVGEMERPIQSLLVKIGTDKKLTLEKLVIAAAKTGPEVLDRTKIEAEQKRAYAMEAFSALIQSKTGEAVLLDIDAIVEQIADQEELKPEVVRLALQKINDAKAKL